jgi:gliding motility-associated-like protein
LTVAVTSAPVTSLTQSLCSGSSITFHGQNISTGGIYTDTLTGTGGCDSVIALSVTILLRPTSRFLLQPAGDSVALGTITATDQSFNADSILWQLNDQFVVLVSGNILPVNDTGYWCLRLIASTTAGCSDTSSQCIYIYNPSGQPHNGFYIPDAFTPNGDGVNDILEVFGDKAGIKYLRIAIYDRWGERVFESDDPGFAWDGRYQGVMQGPGVFSYLLDLTFENSYSIHNKGTITLIR